MPAEFASFEEVPLPALLLTGGATRGNHAARELFQNRLPDAASSLRELLAPKKVKLATGRGPATFRVQPDRAAEGHMVWLIQELDAAHDELEELRAQDAFKTQFLNMAAHELNTPLTPIRLQHHLLTTETIGPLSEQQMKAQEVIGRNLNRLSSLISDILDVARLESKALAVEMKPMDLARVVRDSLDSYSAPAEQVGVELTSEVPEEAVVQGSAERISQV
ncbi:MAG: sensor histidine kinase, partial [Thermoplasmatota archaeon]